MKKGSKLAILIGVVAAIAAVVASLSALLLYLDRKGFDLVLEQYVDCSINCPARHKKVKRQGKNPVPFFSCLQGLFRRFNGRPKR